MSRKSGGTLYKIDLSQGARLRKLDLRVEANSLKIYSATLVTESGNTITVNQFSNSSVLATSSVLSSENISSNERISSIQLFAESYGGEADIIVTAVADSSVPKLSLRKEVAPPVVVTPPQNNGGSIITFPDNGNYGTNDPYNPYNPNDGGGVIYYGSGIRRGDTVMLECDRGRDPRCSRADLWIGSVEQVYGDSADIYIEGDVIEVPMQALSKAVTTFRGFSINDRVIDAQRPTTNSGVIERLFANGFAQVSFGGRSLLLRVSTLQKVSNSDPYAGSNGGLQGCLQNRRGYDICVQDLVQYPAAGRVNYVVTAILGNGYVRIYSYQTGDSMRVQAFYLTSPRENY
jgi:hypothetical protein